MVKVKMLRESYSAENKTVKAGDVVEVTEARAKEMERRRIATREIAAKKAPQPENKKAPEASNKAAPARDARG